MKFLFTKVLLFLALAIGGVQAIHAQQYYIPVDRVKCFTVAADPIRQVLNGYNYELGFQKGKSRFTVSFTGGDLPSYLNPQHNLFYIHNNGFDLAYSRFFNWKQRGLHLGVSVGSVYYESVKLRNTLSSKENSYMRMCLKAGYMIYPFSGALKNFYIEPAFLAGFTLNNEELTFRQIKYNGRRLEILGPFLNIGYKFQLHY